MTPDDFAKMCDAQDSILEAVVGYRTKAKEMDFSDDGAEALAIEFHAMLLRMSQGSNSA